MSRPARRLSLLLVVGVLLVAATLLPSTTTTTTRAIAGVTFVAPTEVPVDGSRGSEISPREVQLEDEVFEPASSLVVVVVAMAVIGGAAFMGRRGRR